MGRLTAGLRRASSTLSWLHAHLPKPHQLYSDRFAHTHEVDPLVSPHWQHETGLLIGVSSFNQVLSVRPKGYALKAGQLTYDCRYSTMHGMPVTGGRGFRSLKPLWYNSVPP